MPHNERRMRAVIAGGLVAPLVMLTGMLGVAQRRPPGAHPERRVPRRLRDRRQAVPRGELRPLPRQREAQEGTELRGDDGGRDAHRSSRALGRGRPEAAPPRDAARRRAPADEHTRQAVAAWLERELARIDRLTPPDPGRVTARRLNREEYNNTIRDLLGVELRPADDFPQDDTGYGFDNIGGRAVALAGADGEIPDGGRPGRPGGDVRAAGDDPDAHRLRSDGPAQRRRADVPGAIRPDRAEPAERVPRHASRAGRSGLRHPRRARRVASARLRPDHADAVGRRARRSTRCVYDAEKAASFDQDRQDFNGQHAAVPRQAAGGRAPDLAWRSRTSTTDCRRVRRPEPGDASAVPAERVHAAGPAPRPNRSRSSGSGSTTRRRQIQKIPLERRAREHGRRRRTRTRRPPARRRASTAKVYTCGHRTGATR